MGKMRRFLRKSSVGSEPLSVTMSGVRLGERALQIGLDDPNIAALIAAKTGMTGQASLVVGDEAAAASARNAVSEAGGLGEVHLVGALHPLPFADDTYDTGPIVVQRCVPVKEGDDPDTLAARVFQAECEAYPEAIELLAAGRVTVQGRRVIISG